MKITIQTVFPPDDISSDKQFRENPFVLEDIGYIYIDDDVIDLRINNAKHRKNIILAVTKALLEYLASLSTSN